MTPIATIIKKETKVTPIIQIVQLTSNFGNKYSLLVTFTVRLVELKFSTATTSLF
jgi:hypothetical protein